MAESRTTYRSLVPPTVGGKAEATVVGAGSGAGARRAGLLGAGGRRAFVIEAMLLLAFLGMALALILQMFAASSRISREAHDQAMLCQLAGNAAQQALATQVEPGSSEAFFDGAGQPCDQAQAVQALYDCETQGQQFVAQEDALLAKQAKGATADREAQAVRDERGAAGVGPLVEQTFQAQGR